MASCVLVVFYNVWVVLGTIWNSWMLVNRYLLKATRESAASMVLWEVVLLSRLVDEARIHGRWRTVTVLLV